MKEMGVCTSLEAKVSVIVPVYNAEKYLPQCLESILSQTLKKIEIICVDDGSTDGSSRILEQYAANDCRIQHVRIENHGAGYARNIGLLRAAGEYLFFLDSDDYIAQTTLEDAYSYAQSIAADVVAFGASYVDDEGKILGTDGIYDSWLQDGDLFSAEDIPDRIFQICSCNTWNKFYKRRFIQENQLEYQDTKTSNDLYFVYSALVLAENVRVLNKFLTFHRVRNSGNLQSEKSKSPMDFLFALERLKSELICRGLWTRYFRSFINCALYHCDYNIETVDEEALSQYCCEKARIISLLELDKHEECFYYDKASLERVKKALHFPLDGGKIVIKKIKTFLKKIVPPPVASFMREINNLTALLQDIRQLLILQKKQTALLMNASSARYDALKKEIDEIQEEFWLEIDRQNKLFTQEANHFTQEVNCFAKEASCFAKEIEHELERTSDRLGVLEYEQESLIEEFKAHTENVDLTVRKPIGEVKDLLQHESEQRKKEHELLSRKADQARLIASESKLYAQETVWAAVFNNAITNSTWLKDKTFSPGRWAVGYPALYVIYRVLNEVRPKHILELGLGQSTRMITQYVAANEDVDHFVVEHDPEWIRFFENDCKLAERTQLIQLEREMVPYKEAEEVRVFKGFEECFASKKFDFIFIDAPYGGDMLQYSRIDVLKILPECLLDDFVILFDDCERKGEKRTALEMKALLEEKIAGCVYGQYVGRRESDVFCSRNRSFITTL